MQRKLELELKVFPVQTEPNQLLTFTVLRETPTRPRCHLLGWHSQSPEPFLRGASTPSPSHHSHLVPRWGQAPAQPIEPPATG